MPGYLTGYLFTYQLVQLPHAYKAMHTLLRMSFEWYDKVMNC